MDGAFIAFGFQNRDIRTRLLKEPKSGRKTTRLTARVGRWLKKLQMHGLVAKVPRSRWWKVRVAGKARLKLQGPPANDTIKGGRH